MLAHILAVLVGTGSVGLYLAAFFLPDIHRKLDFIWSGVGLFYALTLWIYARQEIGGLLVGQMASVALICWFGWQTLILRRQLVPVSQPAPIPGTTKPPERSGLDRSTAKAPKSTAKTASPTTSTASVSPPPATSSSVRASPSPNPAPVQNVVQPPATSSSVRQSPSPNPAPVQNVAQPPATSPSVRQSPSLNPAPVESKLPIDPHPATPSSSSKNDVSEPMRVDVAESTDQAWIELKVKSAPAPKPLGTAAKPPTPPAPTAINPQPQPLLASTTEDRSPIPPTEPIASTARSDAADRE
jgi:Ycf66 protein N-terminus